MDTLMVREMLIDLSKRAGNLSEKLSDKGRPLSEADKELCRIAMLPALTEVMAEIKVAFITEDKKYFETAYDRVRDLWVF